MTDRQCIVTRERDDPDSLLRFVAGPDGSVVPDIRHRLPGRGCWVLGDRATVEKAVAKNAFARALKASVKPDADLPGLTDTLLEQAAIQAVAMARKAGQVTQGAMQVDKAVRSGQALAVLHANEAAADGRRKIDQARRATVHLGGPIIAAFQMFSLDQMDLAFTGGNVIHAAILDGGAGHAALRRLNQLRRYRGLDDGTAELAGLETDEE